MSQGRVVTIFMLLTLIFLGLAAVLVPERTNAGQRASVDLVALTPSEIGALEITVHGETRRAVALAPDRWVFELGEAERAVSWPASLPRVRGFLRILDRLEGVPGADPGDGWRSLAVIRTSTADGRSETLEIGAGTLGGRSLVRLANDEGRTFVTPDELARLVTGPGLAQWLEPRPFGAIQGRVDAVSVRSGDALFLATRNGDRWTIDAPFSAPAEGALIEEMLRGLQSMQISGVEATTSVDGEAEGTLIELFAERREALSDGEIRLTTEQRELRAIGQEDSAATVAVRAAGARDGQPDLGPVSGRISADALGSAVRQPSFYIARRALGALPGDVQTLRLEPAQGGARSWTRGVTTWLLDGDAPVAEPMIEPIVSLLTLEPAATCAWIGTEPVPGARVLASIVAGGVGGAEIGRWTLIAAPVPGGDGETLFAGLVSDGVVRYYEPEAAVDIVQWVVGLSPDG